MTNKNEKLIIEIKNELEKQKYKKKKYIKIGASILCVTILSGGIYTGLAIYKDHQEQKNLEIRREFARKQQEIQNKTESDTKVFLDTLEAKLNDSEQYIKIWDGKVNLHHYKKHQEKVGTVKVPVFGEFKYINEYVDMYGFSDAYVEFGVNTSNKKVHENEEANEVTISIPRGFFNEKVAHRIPGTYTPDPKNPTVISKDAQSKSQKETRFQKISEDKTNILTRATLTWEDSFDKNIIPSLESQHIDSKAIEELDKYTITVAKAFFESFNVNKNLKINVKIDESL